MMDHATNQSDDCPCFPSDEAEAALRPAIAAATVIVMADGEGEGRPQLLMVERAASMAFAAGMAVFPGGRVDPDDVLLGQRLAPRHRLSLTDAAARVAAIRETMEETGLGIGLQPALDAAALQQLRADLVSGAAFSACLDSLNILLDLSALTPFARWRPNHATARVFDTRFYVAQVAGIDASLSVNDGEHNDLFWNDAHGYLNQERAGELTMIFPTLCNLQRLAQFDTVQAVVGAARTIPARRITPRIEQRDGESYLCIPSGYGYPVTERLLSDVRRG